MYDTVDIGRSVRDFTHSDELPEYKNVELIVEDNKSVFAKYSGTLITEADSWAKVHGENQAISFNDGNDVFFYTQQATEYGMGVFSSPAVARYKDLKGKTVHFEADVIIGSGAVGNVVIDAYFRKTITANSGDRLESRQIGMYSVGTHVSFDFEVGDWISTEYDNAYLCLGIVIASEGAGGFSVDNIQFYAVEDDPQTVFVSRCPWATSDIAMQVLESLKGWHYRPYNAVGARLDAAVTYGDNLIIDGGGSYPVFSLDTRFGAELVSDVSAPFDEELEHEFPYVPSTERNFRREVATLRAEIDIRSGEIEAKVEERVPSNYGNSNTFGWTLQSDNFTVYSNGQSVLKVTSGGAEITGRVVATEGKIGDCVIRDGKLEIPSAKITNISADNITVGFLDVARIAPHSLGQNQLGENSVANYQLGTDAVQGYNIYGGAVSPVKTSFGGTLNQVGINQSDISAIKNQLVNILTVNSLTVNGNLFVRGSNGITHAFRPIAYSAGGARYILGSAT